MFRGQSVHLSVRDAHHLLMKFRTRLEQEILEGRRAADRFEGLGEELRRQRAVFQGPRHVGVFHAHGADGECFEVAAHVFLPGEDVGEGTQGISRRRVVGV